MTGPLNPAVDIRIDVASLMVGCDQRGHLLLIKVIAADGATHRIMMPSSIALWFGRNRRKLQNGPYDAPSQPDLHADDWDGSKALVMIDMQVQQAGDALTFTATTASGKILLVAMPPACHALFGHYLAQYWQNLVDVDAAGGQRPA